MKDDKAQLSEDMLVAIVVFILLSLAVISIIISATEPFINTNEQKYVLSQSVADEIYFDKTNGGEDISFLLETNETEFADNLSLSANGVTVGYNVTVINLDNNTVVETKGDRRPGGSFVYKANTYVQNETGTLHRVVVRIW